MARDKIAVLDWGIGGLSVLRALKRVHPSLPVTYLSDTGATPYGKLSAAALTVRLATVIGLLKERYEASHVIIACNAASTVAASLPDQGIRITDMIGAAVGETVARRPTSLGILGGHRTIRSGIYRRQFAKFGISVRQRVAQPLSGMIESGDLDSELLRSTVTQIVAPLKNCSHILLACTHYPAIAAVIKDAVSPSTDLIDPAASVARAIAKMDFDGSRREIFLTTGDPKLMQYAAMAAFRVNISSVEKIKL